METQKTVPGERCSIFMRKKRQYKPLKNKWLVIIVALFFSDALSAQTLKWSTALDFFFDNTEFAQSSFAIDQTMAGVALTQQIGWQFERKHRIMGGVYARKDLGSSRFASTIRPMAYYRLNDKNTLFQVGSFPRQALLNDYSNFFFQDSIAFYKPTLEGFFLRKGNERQFVKLWLDWTGLQTNIERESFFIGVSAYKQFGQVFFADWQSYLFHYATTRPNPEAQSVCDNLLGLFSVGLKYADGYGFDLSRLSVGLLTGFERDRRQKDDYRTPLGLTLQADVRYKRFGSENLFYFGQQRMTLYAQYGNRLYWGNPFLRSSNYFQNKLYWNFLHTRHVTGQLAARTHFSEGKIFFEQMLTLRAHINN